MINDNDAVWENDCLFMSSCRCRLAWVQRSPVVNPHSLRKEVAWVQRRRDADLSLRCKAAWEQKRRSVNPNQFLHHTPLEPRVLRLFLDKPWAKSRYQPWQQPVATCLSHTHPWPCVTFVPTGSQPNVHTSLSKRLLTVSSVQITVFALSFVQYRTCKVPLVLPGKKSAICFHVRFLFSFNSTSI